jgi:uncharacterized protein YjaZ
MAKRQTRETRETHDERNPPDDARDARDAPQQTASGYNQFLKVDDLDDDVTRLVLTGWVRRTVGKYGPQIVVELTHPNGRTYDFGVKEGSPNHRMLFRAMGRDETKWAGAIVVHKTTFVMASGRQSNLAIEIREVESDNPPF